jgi:hypothetical protein
MTEPFIVNLFFVANIFLSLNEYTGKFTYALSWTISNHSCNQNMYDNPLKFNLILNNFTTTAKYVLFGVFENIVEKIIREV